MASVRCRYRPRAAMTGGAVLLIVDDIFVAFGIAEQVHHRLRDALESDPLRVAERAILRPVDVVRPREDAEMLVAPGKAQELEQHFRVYAGDTSMSSSRTNM